MIIRNIKTTRQDQAYFAAKARIKEAAEAGKLGKSWFRKDEKSGKHVLSPKKVINRV